MKDSKGHGSNPRGTAPGYAGRDRMDRTYSQALKDHDRFPRQNPTMPNAEDYRTKRGIPTRPATQSDFVQRQRDEDRAAASALGQNHPKSVVAPVHGGATGRRKK